MAVNLPHDIMHDVLEGVIPYEMKLLLTHYVTCKYFSIDSLNDRLNRFDFGYSELSDKPSEIDDAAVKKPDTKIRESASKMWMLAVMLPLLVGDLVPEDCEYWDLYNLLLRICSIVVSWEISRDTASYLSVLIEEHHTQFKVLYSEATIIPKMHYMVHYPRQILMFGPLIHSWTMRHEAKLSVLKRAGHHGNFKNICYTIAKRSVHSLCYQLNCGHTFLTKTTQVAETKNECLLESESPIVHTYILSLGVSAVPIVHPPWVKFNSFV